MADIGKGSSTWHEAQNVLRLSGYITKLEKRIYELEMINEEHRKLNGVLRKQINDLFNKLTEMGVMK